MHIIVVSLYKRFNFRLTNTSLDIVPLFVDVEGGSANARMLVAAACDLGVCTCTDQEAAIDAGGEQVLGGVA